MTRSIFGKQNFLQLVALAPLAICAGGLYLWPDLTPRWELGLLTYAAVALSYLAALQARSLAARWRGFTLLAPLGAWIAQLVETRVGILYLLGIAVALGIFPLRGHGYRLFALGAAAALAIAAFKVQSYGF